MNTRYATAEDIDELVRVINEAYRVEDFFVFGNRTTPDEIAAMIAAPNSWFIVADDPESGGLAAAVSVDVHNTRGHFGMLSVDPKFQGKGVGRLLINAIEEHCRKVGCTDLDLEVVNLRLELPAYYEKFGFTPSGTAPFTNVAKLRREAHLTLMTKHL